MVDESLTCFKYRSADSAIRCLAEGSLYFAAPNELNDTVEAKFDAASCDEYLLVFRRMMNELAASRNEPGNYQAQSDLLKELEEAIRAEDKNLQEASARVGIFSAAPRPDNQPMWAYYCNGSNGVCLELIWSRTLMEQYTLV
ncbi:MAG: hypothetical protein HY255_06320, partial [Betaproteobacteria bacterium]|nr:hypothetical protein [Betaproteobacteria bacterium]